VRETEKLEGVRLSQSPFAFLSRTAVSFRMDLTNPCRKPTANRVADTGTIRPSGVATRVRMTSPARKQNDHIGATALSRGMTLATRNTSHFKRLGVSMVDPFA
jgi:hypothetical protein